MKKGHVGPENLRAETAASVLGTWQGARGNPSELFVVHACDLPGGLMARLLGNLLLYLPWLARAWAAVTQDHGWGGSSNTRLFLSVLEAGKSKNKVPSSPVPGEVPLPGLEMAILSLYPPKVERRTISAVSLIIRGLVLYEGFTLVT